MSKCCGKSKLNIDYSGVLRTPYFAKRKDKEKWEKEQKATQTKPDKSADKSQE